MVVGVCVYTDLIPALKRLLFLCTVGALEFSSTEMILCTYIAYYILKVLGLTLL